ncbi:hypothetical protein YC2023_122800 [Brassica napus]
MAEEVPKLVEANEGMMMSNKERYLGMMMIIGDDLLVEVSHVVSQELLERKGLEMIVCTTMISRKYSCNNSMTRGFCHRGDSCLFTHKTTNLVAPSSSPLKSNNLTVREAIAKLPAIQAQLRFLSPLSDEHATTTPQIPPLRNPSVAPKGMCFLCLDKTTQEEDTLKPFLVPSKSHRTPVIRA